MRSLATLTAYSGHMIPVLADRFPSFLPGSSSFVRCKFVGRPFYMGRPATSAGDFPLPVGIHRGKPSSCGSFAVRSSCHTMYSCPYTHIPPTGCEQKTFSCLHIRSCVYS